MGLASVEPAGAGSVPAVPAAAAAAAVAVVVKPPLVTLSNWSRPLSLGGALDGQLARVGRAGGDQRCVGFAVGHGAGEVDEARGDQRRVDDREVVAVDHRGVLGAVGVGAEHAQIVRLALHDRDADAGVGRGADRAETGRRTGGDDDAVDVEHLDVQVAAGGQQSGIVQVEINLEIQRAGVLGHHAVIILIGWNEREFHVVREDGDVVVR